MSIGSVLIANRGEIAVRIIRACRDLGIRSVAVYSEADRDAPFVAAADDALLIGPAPARASYLNAEAIITAAKRAGTDAVHPGYGFLAENAQFARACAESGLRFIGPSADIIERMGAKRRAKAAAHEAGVPILPGYHGEDQSDESLTQAASEIGFPLMIKACAGGGGRGMRRVETASDLADALAMARRESETAFGDPSVLLEHYLGRSRHLEVQILADRHGNVVHLFERDCSIQRNHQKVIEEAPGSNLPEAVRQAMLDQSVALAKQIGYDSAGTVEFIYDPQAGDAFFLEMNTRLQVEHPVTEMITGIDLVAWQIRIAAGEPLPFAQNDISCDGWAIEARIAAEDPSRGYRPQTGKVDVFKAPEGTGIRVDSGVAAGTVVGHHYDSMLAKVIAHGHDRETARRRLARALRDAELAGLVTNIAFLRDVVALPHFVAGNHTTSLLTEAFPDGWQAPEPSRRELAEAALAVLIGRHTEESPWRSLGSWRVTEPAGRGGRSYFHIHAGGALIAEACIRGRSGAYRVDIDGDLALDARSVRFAAGILSYEENGRRRKSRIPSGLRMLSPDEALLGRERPGGHGGNAIRAPIPGMLAELRVDVGDSVAEGDDVVVFEAMKLLQTLSAPVAGRVVAIHHAVGDPVDGNSVIVEIEASQ